MHVYLVALRTQNHYFEGGIARSYSHAIRGEMAGDSEFEGLFLLLCKNSEVSVRMIEVYQRRKVFVMASALHQSARILQVVVFNSIDNE